eukprot:TRINITY_DN22333_c0_g1_i2.p1 TRINITY_DN22333_c0_g1~~TRINITY_DN22333_c0_g1_i2.p1  ORF type:complete len:841 (+),score=119.78 TRINITY_DN22333_c0_g1_i2:30-2552(+)
MWTFWPAGRHQDAHDVQLLLQRLRTATSLHDKREAVAQLCTKEARVIGAEGMVYLIELLRTDAGDLELLCGVMDLLSKLTADADCGPFLNVFIQSPTDGDDVAHPVRLVLDVLRNDDFMVRYSAVQLLTRLLQHNSKAVTEQILRAPNSVASLVDILEDSRESVRNEGLLLLKALVANDPELQAAVAFSNGFELLFNIIKEESKVGSTTVIIDDALQVINALLRNPVTQRSFREMGFFAQLNELLLFDGQEVGLDTNGVIQTVIDIVHMVVSASVPVAERQKTKHVLCATSIVANLVNLLVSPYCSTATTLRALLTLRVLAEGDTEVHRIVLGPVWEINGGPAPTGLVVLLQIVMNDTDDQRQKLALEVVKHILVDPQGQVFVAASVKPLAPGPLTPGQVLASALFSSATTGIVPMYYAAHLLQFAVHGNPEAKLQLLHALWDTGSFFRTLVRQITDSIRGRNHVATVLCMRVLLALVDESPTSAAALLEDATRLAFFVQTTISDDEDLHTQGLCALLVGLLCLYYPEEPSGELTRKQVYDNLVRRIGFDCFSERWTRLRSDPQFQNAGRIPHAVLYDEFYAAFLINIYERVATYVKQQVTSIDSVFEMARNREQVNMNDEQLQQAFQSAQQCILLQEQELTTLREELRSTKESARMSQSYQAEVARLERDYAAAVTKVGAISPNPVSTMPIWLTYRTSLQKTKKSSHLKRSKLQRRRQKPTGCGNSYAEKPANCKYRRACRRRISMLSTSTSCGSRTTSEHLYRRRRQWKTSSSKKTGKSSASRMPYRVGLLLTTQQLMGTPVSNQTTWNTRRCARQVLRRPLPRWPLRRRHQRRQSSL